MTDAKITALNQAALDWAVRMQDPGFDDWDEHLAWLEEDVSHPVQYRVAALALSDSLAVLEHTTVQAVAIPANDDEISNVRRRVHRGWLVGGAAAIAASAIAMFLPHSLPMDRYHVVATAAGETRTVSLADGTTLTLNGDTVVRTGVDNGRQAILDRGEVFINVVHDVRHPFSLVVGDALFEDVGTSFNARVDGDETSVGVLEGAVAYDPRHADIMIGAGKTLVVSQGNAKLRPVEAAGIGSWRSGRLIYANVDMTRAATDLSRSLGIQVRLSDKAAARTFSGVVVLEDNREKTLRQFALLADVSVRREGKFTLLDVRD